MRGMKKCASKMQSITAENILLLAHRGTLAKLFARYLLTLCAVSQSLLLLKGSGVLYPMIGCQKGLLALSLWAAMAEPCRGTGQGGCCCCRQHANGTGSAMLALAGELQPFYPPIPD